MAAHYDDQEKYDLAEPLYKRALEVIQKVPEHPDRAYILTGLAAHYYDEERYTEAEPLFKRALVIAQESQGADGPLVAIIAERLALTLRQLGRHGEAIAYENQAALIRARQELKKYVKP